MGKHRKEYTINLHKRLHRVQYKKRAPEAIKELMNFVKRKTLAKKVYIDTKVNKAIWAQGICKSPNKLRIIVSNKRIEKKSAIVELDLVSYASILKSKMNQGTINLTTE